MKYLNLIVRLGVVFCSIATASMNVGAQSVLLSPKVIQAAWVGKTMVGTLPSGPSAGKQIEFTMNLDGTAVLAGVLIDTGTWRLSESGYCATWKKIRAGQERCFTVVRNGTDFLVNNPDGSLSTTITAVR